MSSPPARTVCSARAIAALGFAAMTVAAPVALGVVAPPAPAHAARPRQPGDVLHLFDKQRVWIVTNDGVTVADNLLDGCKTKERRTLSVAEWLQTPRDAATRAGVMVVFLVNRENLPVGRKLPERCDARPTEVWTDAFSRRDRRGVLWEITISAPDGAQLRRAVSEFRQMRDVPRQAVRADSRSLAVVAVSPSAAGAGEVWTAPDAPGMGHAVALERISEIAGRLENADEVLLIDRSATPSSASVSAPLVPDWVKTALDKPGIAPGDTVAWREAKTDVGEGSQTRAPRWRVVFSAPTAGALQAATARYPLFPDQIGDGVVVLGSARDLRQVRRVAVASVKNGANGELARRLSSRAAQETRALDAFEVLERTGLTEILGEVALGQAGLVDTPARAKVRKLAAADALLIVEVSQASGHTEYAAAHERLTPKMDAPPRRPPEPSRLRSAVAVPGQEDNRVVRGVLEAVLAKVVGTRSDDEYKELMDAYNNETLPSWQRSYDFYQRQRERRAIEWRRTVSARRTASVTGSLRLVDLADGLVLWEAPFTGTATDDAPVRSLAVTSRGEDSSPDAGDLPPSEDAAPAELITRAAETALSQGVATLRETALLPAPVAVPAPVAPETAAPAPPAAPLPGRVLDVDGDGVLIGLGAGDGVRVGDIISITVASDNAARKAANPSRSVPSALSRPIAPPLSRTVVRVRVTRVRPRTSDAVWLANTPGALRIKIAPGDAATLEQAAR